MSKTCYKIYNFENAYNFLRRHEVVHFPRILSFKNFYLPFDFPITRNVCAKKNQTSFNKCMTPENERKFYVNISVVYLTSNKDTHTHTHIYVYDYKALQSLKNDKGFG